MSWRPVFNRQRPTVFSPFSSRSSRTATCFCPVSVCGPSNAIATARHLGLFLVVAQGGLLGVCAHDFSIDACDDHLCCRRLCACRVIVSGLDVYDGALGPVSGFVFDVSSCARGHRLCVFVTSPSSPSCVLSRRLRHPRPWLSRHHRHLPRAPSFPVASSSHCPWRAQAPVDPWQQA
jgi:hypothetical protein